MAGKVGNCHCLGIERPARESVGYGGRWLEKIGVHKVREPAAKTAEIRNGNDRVGGDFPLKVQIEFVDHRIFRVWSKLHGLQSRGVSGRHDVRIERFAGSSLVEEERAGIRWY